MTLLVDRELKSYIHPNEGVKSLVEGVDESDMGDSAESAIQAASIDLKIGKIYIPGVKPSEKGGINNGLLEHTLRPGATVIVESKEKLNVPIYLAGIGFPPASLAVKGLLMTNAGHIDPGYVGKLSFTLINMSKEDFILVSGKKIFSILFLRLSGEVEFDISARNGGVDICGGIKQDNLERLNKDFLDVENRAKQIVRKTSGIITTCLTLGLGALMAIVANLIDRASGVDLEKRLSQIEANISLIEFKYEIHPLKDRIEVLNANVAEFNNENVKRIELITSEVNEIKSKLNVNNP